MQILIAEDDPVSRKTLSAMLKKQGHEAVETCDGEEAWQVIQEQGVPRLIILDIIMPNMDGIELCRRIRAEFNWNPPYIIFVTAKTQKEDVVQGLEAGANDYISKPYEFQELWARINVGQRMLEMQSALFTEVEERKQTQEKLRQERDTAQKYLDIAKVIFLALDKQGKVTLVNQKGSQILGYEKEEILGKHWFKNFIPVRNRADQNTGFQDLMRDETELLEYYENPVLTRNGEERIIAWYNTVLKDDEGNTYGTLSSGEDITKRRKFEKNLFVSEKKFRDIFNNVSDAIYIHKMDGRFVEVNKTACQLLGYTQEELLGMTLSDIDVPQESGKVEERIKSVQQNGDKIFESFHRCKNGQEFPVEIKSQVIEYEGQYCILSVARDISERKQAEEKLRQSEKKYRQERDYLDNLFENSADAIAIVDKSGRFIRWNKRATELFGYSFEEMRGKHFSEFYVHKEEMENTLAKLRKNGFIWAEERSFINRDGSIRPCSISISMLYDENHEPSGSISIVRDLTEWKNTLQKLEEMSLYDSLTGLYNRSFFEEEMKRLSHSRYCPIGIIVCDINGLKLINDTLGHHKGDDLLRTSANILRKCFRASDITARIGGDEFAVLLPESGEQLLQTCRHRIRKEVEKYNIQYPELGLSLSIGYALEKDFTVDIKDLFKRADDAMYKEKLQQSYSSRSETVQALLKALEARDHITEGHADRMTDYALGLGKTLGLTEERLNDLHLLSRFHDLGKVGIPDSILFKPDRLTPREYEEMKRHCEIGHKIALSLSDLAPVADYILKHHEWWNGQGYPLGLKGSEIPLECRILAIADAFDAMTSERPYQKAMSSQDALKELRTCAGTQFDPELVEKFSTTFEKDKEDEDL